MRVEGAFNNVNVAVRHSAFHLKAIYQNVHSLCYLSPQLLRFFHYLGHRLWLSFSNHYIMNKCYLLLRNNKETGPFSIAELLQLSLTPKDLVWVQGKSAGWRYPAEIDELKEVLVTENLPLEPVANNKQEEPVAAGLPKERKTSPKKIFISLPAGKRKEAIVVAPSFEEKAGSA